MYQGSVSPDRTSVETKHSASGASVNQIRGSSLVSPCELSATIGRVHNYTHDALRSSDLEETLRRTMPDRCGAILR